MGRAERLVALPTEDVTAVSDSAGRAEKLLFPTLQRMAAALRDTLKPNGAEQRLVGGSPSLHVGVVNSSPAVIDGRVEESRKIEASATKTEN